MVATLTSHMVARVRQGLAALTLGTMAMSSGCSFLDATQPFNECESCTPQNPNPGAKPSSAVSPPTPPAPVPPPPLQGQTPKTISMYWEHELKVAPDTTHDGQAMPGLVGRMFLFDERERMLCYEGTMTVKLFDERPAQGGPEVCLEQWNFNKESLQKLRQRDPMIGWGYTIFLPTATCNPNVKFVRLAVSYTPEGSTTAIMGSSTMRMQYPEPRPNTPAVQPAGGFVPGQPMTYSSPLGGAPAIYGPQGFGPQQQPGMADPSLGLRYTSQVQVPCQPWQTPAQYVPQQAMPLNAQQVAYQQPYQANMQQQVLQGQYQGVMPQMQYQANMQQPMQPQYQANMQQPMQAQYQGGSQPMQPQYQGGTQQVQQHQPLPGLPPQQSMSAGLQQSGPLVITPQNPSGASQRFQGNP